MSRHEDWIQFGIKLCKSSDKDFYKMTAIIVKSGNPVSIGFAARRTSPNTRSRSLYKPHQGLHCEVAAILNMPLKDLSRRSTEAVNELYKGCDLYVTGVTKHNALILSKPCKACQEVLNSLPFKSVYYHDKDGVVHKLEKEETVADTTDR